MGPFASISPSLLICKWDDSCPQDKKAMASEGAYKLGSTVPGVR